MAVLFILAAVEFKVLATTDKDDEKAAVRGYYGIGLQFIVGLGLVATSVIGVASALISLYQQDTSTVRDLEVVGTMLAQVVFVTALALLNWVVPLSMYTLGQWRDDARKAKDRGETYKRPKAHRRWLIAACLGVGSIVAVWIVPVYALVAWMGSR
jgi:hypothetical protein